MGSVGEAGSSKPRLEIASNFRFNLFYVLHALVHGIPLAHYTSLSPPQSFASTKVERFIIPLRPGVCVSRRVAINRYHDNHANYTHLVARRCGERKMGEIYFHFLAAISVYSYMYLQCCQMYRWCWTLIAFYISVKRCSKKLVLL